MTNELGNNGETSELASASLDHRAKNDLYTKTFESDRNLNQSSSNRLDTRLDHGDSFEDEFAKARELTAEEKSALKAEHPGRSDSTIDNTRIDENGNELLKTRNSELEGKVIKDNDGNVVAHYDQQTFEDGNGQNLTGVFLVFDDPKASVTLPPEKEHSANSVQFNECNKQLLQQIEKNPELAKQFTPEQLSALKNSDYQHPTIPGLVWHHQPEDGKMILVDKSVHENRHTGGNAIWGGSTDGAY